MFIDIFYSLFASASASSAGASGVLALIKATSFSKHAPTWLASAALNAPRCVARSITFAESTIS